MFVNDDTIEITLFVKRTGSNTTRVETSLDRIPEPDREKYQKVTFKTRPLTWKQHNDIQSAAMVDRGTGGGAELDWVKYKEHKLIAVLVGWDATNAEGKPVPLNKESVYKLQPVVAETLLNEFDRKTMIGDEERKN